MRNPINQNLAPYLYRARGNNRWEPRLEKHQDAKRSFGRCVPKGNRLPAKFGALVHTVHGQERARNQSVGDPKIAKTPRGVLRAFWRKIGRHQSHNTLSLIDLAR